MNLGTAVGAIQLVYDGAGVQQAKADLASLSQQTAQQKATQLAAGTALAGVGAGALKFTQDAVGIAADVQSTMNSVRAATGATEQEIAALDATVGTLGKDTVFSAQEIAGASDTMAKAGINVEDQVGGALKTVTDLAAATGESLETAAGTTADAMATFQLSGEEVTQVADLTTQAVNASKIGLAEYNAGFRNLAPTMSAFADNSEEAIELLGDTGQVIAFFTSQGLKGADAGISFSRMIQNLATPSTEAYAEAIDQAGINLFDMEGNFVGAEEAIRQVHAAFDGLTDQQIIDKLDQLGIGAEALDVVTNIASKGAEFDDFVAGMESGATAAEAADIRMQGLNGALEALSGSVSEVMRQMGTGLLAPFEAVIRGITELVNAFFLLPPAIQQSIGVFTGVVGVLASLAGSFLLAKAGAALFGVALGPLAALLAPIAGAILAIAIAAAALFAAYQSNFMGFKDTVDAAIGGAKKTIDNFGKSLSNTFAKRQEQGFNSVAAGIMAVGQALDFSLGTDWSDDFFRLGDAVQTFGDHFAEATAAGINPLVAALGSASDAAEQLGFEGVAEALDTTATAAQNFMDQFEAAKRSSEDAGFSDLESNIRALGEAIQVATGLPVAPFFAAMADAIQHTIDVAEQLADAIQDKLSQALDFLGSNVLPGVLSGIGNLLGTIKDVGAELIGGDFSQAGQILGDAIGQVGEWAGGVVQGIGDAIGSVDWGGVVSTIANGLGSALQGIGDFISGINFSGIAGAIGQTILGAASAVGSFLGGLATIVGNAITGALTGIANFVTTTDFGSVVQKISDLLLQAFNSAGDFLGTVAATIGSKITAAMQSVGTFLGGISFNDVVTNIGGLLESAFNGIGTFLSGIPSTVGSAIGTALSTVGNFLGSLNFGTLVSNVVNAITSAFGGGGGGGGGGVPSPGLGAGGGGLSAIASVLGSQLTSVLNTIGNFISGFNPGTMVTDVVNSITEKFNGATFDLAAFGENIKSALEEACGIDLSTIFDTLGTAVQNASIALGDFAAYMSGHIETIKQALADVDFSGAFTTLTGAISAVRNAITTLASEIGSHMQGITSAIADFEIPPALSALGSLIATLLERFRTFASEIPVKLGEVVDAFANIEIPNPFDALGGFIDGAIKQINNMIAKIGELGTELATKLPGGGGTMEESLAAHDAGTKALMEQGGLLGSDQAQAAANMAGDFATNFVQEVANSFTTADWSPVKNAIDAGLNTVMSGTTGGGVPSPGLGGGGDAGVGATFVQGFIESIVGAFTPEAFAPIKAAFDAAMDAAMAGGGKGAPAEGGQGDTIAQTIITGIASGFGKGVEILKPALQAVVLSAGQGITGLEVVGTTIVQQVSSGLGQATATVVSAFNAVITTVITAGNTAAAAAQTVGTALTTAAGQGVGAGTGAVVAAVQAMVTTVIAAGVAAAGAASEIGSQVAIMAGTGVGGSTGDFIAAVQAMVQTAIDAGVAAAAGASAIGAAVSEGAASGVILTAMNDAVSTMVANGIQAGMDAAKAASPSQEAIDKLGMPIAEGAAIGVEQGAPQMADATVDMVNTAMEAARPAIEAAIALFEKFGLEIPAAWQSFMDEAAPAAEGAMTETATDAGTATGDALTEGVTTSTADGTTEVVDAAGTMGQAAGQAATDGAAQGITETAPVVEDAMTTTVNNAMGAAEAAMEGARELFAKYGMTFGNDLNANLAQGLAGGGGVGSKVGDAARQMADQIRSNVEERIAAIRAKAADMQNLQGMMDERERRMGRPEANQPIEIHLTTELDGEPLDRRIIQTAVTPMMGAFESVGRSLGGDF